MGYRREGGRMRVSWALDPAIFLGAMGERGLKHSLGAMGERGLKHSLAPPHSLRPRPPSTTIPLIQFIDTISEKNKLAGETVAPLKVLC